MSSPDGPGTRPHRATDGLDWRPPPGDAPADASASPVFPSTTARARHLPWTLLAVATLSALVGGLVAGIIVAAFAGDDSDSSPVGPARGGGSVTVEISSAISDAAAKARPSVVKILSTRRVPGGIERDVGSGVVLDDAGHIVTNAHVVVGTETLTVVLADGSERPAILIGHDAPFNDVAVIQVSPGGLAPIAEADSSTLVQGQTVIAIGNPLAEFSGSVTVGVVSGVNRTRVLDGVRQDDLVQTDAPINSGNSGGALVDLEGRFVGMPTVVLRQTEQGLAVEGVAFALPSDRVFAVARQIIDSGGHLARPDLGVQHLDISAANPPRGIRLSVEQGALITAVTVGGPAAAAGIQPGDVVTEVAGEPIDETNLLLNRLMAHSPGEDVRVVLNRAGRIIELDVRLGTRT